MLLVFLKLLLIVLSCLLPGAFIVTGLYHKYGFLQQLPLYYLFLISHLMSLLVLLLWGIFCFVLHIDNFAIQYAFYFLLLAMGLTLFGDQKHLKSGLRLFLHIAKYSLLPVLLTVFIAFYNYSLVKEKEVNKGVFWGNTALRIGIMAEPVGVLQYYLSSNLIKKKPLETRFNPDGNQIWSVGDRPMFIGITSAVVQIITGFVGLSVYQLYVIYLGSMLPFLVVILCKDIFKFSLKISVLLSCLIILHPFFINSIFYNVPKIPAVSFLFIGTCILFRLMQNKIFSIPLFLLVGLSFMFSALSHESCIFGIFCAMIFSSSFLLYKKSCKPFAKYMLAVIIPVLIGIFIQSKFSSNFTNASGLGTRVSLFRQGSFAYPTPKISLKQAATNYYEKVGFVGILQDRKESLKRAFFTGYYDTLSVFSMRVFQLNRKIMYQPIFTYGFLSLPVFLLAVVYLSLFKKLKSFLSSDDNFLSMIFPLSGITTLILFASLMGEYTEVGSPQIPNSLHLFIFLGVAILLTKINEKLGIVFCLVQFMFFLYVLIGRDFYLINQGMQIQNFGFVIVSMLSLFFYFYIAKKDLTCQS